MAKKVSVFVPIQRCKLQHGEFCHAANSVCFAISKLNDNKIKTSLEITFLGQFPSSCYIFLQILMKSAVMNARGTA